MNYQDFKLAQEKELNEFTSKYCFWALGLSARDVVDNEVLRNAFVKAVQYIKEQDC